MVTQIQPQPEQYPAVIVVDGIVRIVEMTETDPEVVRVVSEAEDPEAAAHILLRIGAQAARVAAVDLSSELVEHRFSVLAGTFDATVSQAVAAISETTEGLLDQETGALPQVMGELRSDLAQILGDTFDPDSKTSAIARIEAAVITSAEQLVRGVRTTFSLDQPDSPLARTKTELVEVVKEEARAVLDEVRCIGQNLATQSAVATVAAKLTSKGEAFEEFIAAQLEPIADVHGDIVELVGRATGVKGTKKGDLLVTINPDDTIGCVVQFGLEAKHERLSMTKTLAAIDATLANHATAAALAVFASPADAPIYGPFWHSGNRAILVLDREDPDPGAVRLAYEWGRWVCRRSVQEAHAAAVDLVAVQTAIERAVQAIQRHKTIKSCLSGIKNKADEAGTHVAGLVAEVEQAIRDLKAALNDDPDQDAA